MDILANISIEVGTVIVTTLVASIIAPFARSLGHIIFHRLTK